MEIFLTFAVSVTWQAWPSTAILVYVPIFVCKKSWFIMILSWKQGEFRDDGIQTDRIISPQIRSMWETTVMHKQVSGWAVNFGPNFPEYPFSYWRPEYPPPHFQKTSDLGWPKFTLEYPPPHFRKLQIWDDQSLLRNTPPILENFRFGMTKVYSGIPPISENFRFGMTKVYSGIPPPILENFRFGMTKVYSGIPPPHFGKLQIWDDQSLLRNTPPPF